MGKLDASIVVSIVTGIGVIITAVFAFMGNKKGTLATAEHNFRATILAENERLRKRVDELEAKLDTMMEENSQLRITVLQQQAQIQSAMNIVQNGMKNNE